MPRRVIVVFSFLLLVAWGRPGLGAEFLLVDEGNVRLQVNDRGMLGQAWSLAYQPSCEFPPYSGAEHLYLGGFWVGARMPDGQVRVSTSVQDANGLSEALEMCEFVRMDDLPSDPAFRRMSNSVFSQYYDPDALAPTHVECRLRDTGLGVFGHVPLGLEVTLRVLAWPTPGFEDFVIFDYLIQNASGADLRDVYVGFFTDTIVGNTNVTNPWSYTGPFWNYYDDLNGGWRPGDFTDDPGLWMMYEHDDDGESGLAESWVGCRLLGVDPPVVAPLYLPPVSYNCWRYRRVPAEDDWYTDDADPETPLPGKYQLMGNGDFDIGVTLEEDYTTPSNRVGLLSTGPLPILADGAVLRAAFALVLGEGEPQLQFNSRTAQLLHDRGYEPGASTVGDAPATKPTLWPAAPNPFNPSTEIRFELPAAGHARLGIYDVAGRLVNRLLDEHRAAGPHSVLWDGRSGDGEIVPAGVYLCRLEAAGVSMVRRAVLVK